MSEQSSIVEVYQLHVWLCEILPLFGAGDEAEAVGTPLESRYPIKDGRQRLQIQGEPWTTTAPSSAPPTSSTGVG